MPKLAVMVCIVDLDKMDLENWLGQTSDCKPVATTDDGKFNSELLDKLVKSLSELRDMYIIEEKIDDMLSKDRKLDYDHIIGHVYNGGMS